MEAVTPRRRLSRGERRKRILRAAAEAFATRGYKAAGLEEIAAAAGISKAVVYDHFDSKEQLHRTLLEQRLGDLLAVVAEAVARPSTPEERMRAGVDAVLEFVERDRFAWRALFREPDGGPTIDEFHRELQRRVDSVVQGWFERELRETEAEEPEFVGGILTALFTGTLTGVTNWWYEHPDVPRKVLVDATMAFAWDGLGSAEGTRWPPPGGPEPA